jgi:hypothetical protein
MNTQILEIYVVSSDTGLLLTCVASFMRFGGP